MALRLIVDGYNLIGARADESFEAGGDAQLGRERLIEDLRRYKRVRGLHITVVFDGEHTPRSSRNAETCKGIRVVFTRGMEKADDLIVKMVERSPDGFLVVSSDREVAERCGQMGASVISSQAFSERMLLAGTMTTKDQPEEKEDAPRFTTKKRGPSRRLGKQGRRNRRRFGKL